MSFDDRIIITKLIHISLIGILTFFLGSIFSINLNSFATQPKKFKKKTTFNAILEICIYISVIYISHYFVRNIIDFLNINIISKILFWSNKINYDINKLKNLGGGIAMAFAVYAFSDRFKVNSKYLFTDRIKKYIKIIPLQ